MLNDFINSLIEPLFDVAIKGEKKKLVENQRTNDIAQAVLVAEYNSRSQSRKFVDALRKNYSNPVEQMAALHHLVRKNLKYIAEPKEEQTVKEFNKIFYDSKKGNDCKHYSIGIMSILRGLKIPAYFRMVSYDKFNNTPSHIYVVAKYNGKNYILDACMRRFNHEQPYTSRLNIKPLKPLF